MGAAGIARVRRGAVAPCHGRRGDRTRTPWRPATNAAGRLPRAARSATGAARSGGHAKRQKA